MYICIILYYYNHYNYNKFIHNISKVYTRTFNLHTLGIIVVRDIYREVDNY